MIIAIDYDGTWSADPELFAGVAKLAAARGHEVWCVTARSDAMMGPVLKMVGPVIGEARCISVGRLSKAATFKRLRGVDADIWIDDMPESVRPLALSRGGVITPVDLQTIREKEGDNL
jgi:hypothetical protein